jgi:TRAP-type C4-dicarboxylate transport system permease small subunit
MRRPASLFRRGAELLCAALFAAMFGAFVLQIFSRYVLNDPIAWTQEVCTLLYVWVVCLGSATIVSEREHVTFDLVYKHVSAAKRRAFAVIGTAFLTVVLIAALPGNIDYFAFMARQRTPTLRLPMTIVIGAFVVFMILQIAHGGFRLWRLTRPGWEEEP